jgi:hypothetical protein
MGKEDGKVVRPAVDYEAVKLLRDNPKRYAEKEKKESGKKVPFGFSKKS